jgi:hypothetical protein
LRNEKCAKSAGLRPADSRRRLSSHFDLADGRGLFLHFDMSNEELIQRFESGAVSEGCFHHADHVRLAFAYLSQYAPLRALDEFSSALKRFAAALGKSQLYNETITHAYFFLIRERMARSGSTDWDEFILHNSDLLSWKNGILTRYYREETLQSDLARRVFLFPDKCR